MTFVNSRHSQRATLSPTKLLAFFTWTMKNNGSKFETKILPFSQPLVSERDLENGPLLGNVKFLMVDKHGLCENISENDMKQVAKIVQRNFLPLPYEIGRNVTALQTLDPDHLNSCGSSPGGSFQIRDEDLPSITNSESLAQVTSCSLAIPEDNEVNEFEDDNPVMNYNHSNFSESGLFQLTIKISLVSIFLLSLLLVGVIFSIPTPYNHGQDNSERKFRVDHVEGSHFSVVNTKFRSPSLNQHMN